MSDASRCGVIRMKVCKLARSDEGSLTLEACVSVLLFLILALLFASFFPMFMVQNMTAHALLETSQSLSVDAYAAKKLGRDHFDSIQDISMVFLDKLNITSITNDAFATDKTWYEQDEDHHQSVDDYQTGVVDLVKQRFVAYLGAGDDGRTMHEREADELLERYKVEKGLDGIDFTGTEVRDGYLNIKITYTFHNDFSVLDFKPFVVTQTTKSKIWS